MPDTGKHRLPVSTRFLHIDRTKPVLSSGPVAPFVASMAASADALVPSVPVASDAPVSSGAKGLRQKAAISAAGKRWRK